MSDWQVTVDDMERGWFPRAVPPAERSAGGTNRGARERRTPRGLKDATQAEDTTTAQRKARRSSALTMIGPSFPATLHQASFPPPPRLHGTNPPPCSLLFCARLATLGERHRSPTKPFSAARRTWRSEASVLVVRRCV